MEVGQGEKKRGGRDRAEWGEGREERVRERDREKITYLEGLVGFHCLALPKHLHVFATVIIFTTEEVN